MIDDPLLEASLVEDVIARAHLANHVAGDESFETYGAEIFLCRTSVQDIHAVDPAFVHLARIYAVLDLIGPQSRFWEVIRRG